MNSQFAAQLERIVGTSGVAYNEPMARHTTFKIGGSADYFVEPRRLSDIQKLVRLCAEQSVDLHVLGQGSNVLVADEGVRGVVMHLGSQYAHFETCKELSAAADAVLVKAQAGVKNNQLARFVCDCGLTGFEFASGIPGVVGGSALMNAGAYGSEYSQVVDSLVCVTPSGEVSTISGADAQWGYRQSRMHDEQLIISEVVFRFLPGNKAEIKARMDDLAQRRKSKQPLNMPSAGSTFKRPEGYFAGKLIQDAHLQGERIGGAEVSRKHAGFIVNAGGATARDVYQLIAHVQDRVFETAGVHLEPEVRMWGFKG